jgi:hypothetical protein
MSYNLIVLFAFFISLRNYLPLLRLCHCAFGISFNIQKGKIRISACKPTGSVSTQKSRRNKNEAETGLITYKNVLLELLQ